MGKRREAVWLELFAHIPVDTLGDYHTLLKKNGQNIPPVMYKEILKRSGTKSYMRNAFLTNEKIRE